MVTQESVEERLERTERERDEAIAKLREYEARRCDGCKWKRDKLGDDELRDVHCENFSNFVERNHYCKSWSKK